MSDGGWTTPVTAEEVDGDGTAAPRRNNTQAKSEINFNDAGAESTINKHSYGCRPLSVLFSHLVAVLLTIVYLKTQQYERLYINLPQTFTAE